MKVCFVGMLATVCVLGVACSKKAEEPKVVEEQSVSETSMVGSVTDQAVERVEAVKEQATQQIAAVQEKAEKQIAVVKEQATAKVEEYKEVLVSATRPLSEIKAEAEGLNIDQLKTTALEYKDAIAAKGEELLPILTTLKELPMAQKFSAEGLQIKDELAGVQQSVDALKERYDVYANKLKELGVDLSDFMK